MQRDAFTMHQGFSNTWIPTGTYHDTSFLEGLCKKQKAQEQLIVQRNN